MSGHRPSSRGPRGTPNRPARGAGRASTRPGRRSGPVRQRTPATAARPPRPRFTGRAAILVLVVAVLSVSWASSMRAYLEQRSHLADLRADIAASQEEIAALEREKRRWRDPAYIEAQATRRFGWVMPGEIGFQVIDLDGRPLNPPESLSDPAEVEVVNEPAWWSTAWASVEAAGHPEDQPHPAGRIQAPKKKDRR